MAGRAVADREPPEGRSEGGGGEPAGRVPGSIFLHGAVAGAVGAVVLALWFFLVDAAQGAPLRTPAMVGSALFGMDDMRASPGLIALFSLIHLVAFMVVGVLAAWAVSGLRRIPHLILGVVLGFLLFDVVFFGSAMVTGIDVVARLGWVEVLTGNMLAGLAIMNYFHLTGAVEGFSWVQALADSRIVREGIVGGLAAGIAVALWFLVVDLVQGRPFFTPSALGSVFFLGATDLAEVQVSFWVALAYTPLHFAVFGLVGTAASALASEAESQPPILIGAALLFITFEAFFMGVMAVVAEFLLGPLAWWSIAIGNFLAVGVLVGYLWKAHPQLRKVVRHGRLEQSA